MGVFKCTIQFVGLAVGVYVHAQLSRLPLSSQLLCFLSICNVRICLSIDQFVFCCYNALLTAIPHLGLWLCPCVSIGPSHALAYSRPKIRKAIENAMQRRRLLLR